MSLTITPDCRESSGIFVINKSIKVSEYGVILGDVMIFVHPVTVSSNSSSLLKTVSLSVLMLELLPGIKLRLCFIFKLQQRFKE